MRKPRFANTGSLTRNRLRLPCLRSSANRTRSTASSRKVMTQPRNCSRASRSPSATCSRRGKGSDIHRLAWSRTRCAGGCLLAARLVCGPFGYQRANRHVGLWICRLAECMGLLAFREKMESARIPTLPVWHLNTDVGNDLRGWSRFSDPLRRGWCYSKRLVWVVIVATFRFERASLAHFHLHSAKFPKTHLQQPVIQEVGPSLAQSG